MTKMDGDSSDEANCIPLIEYTRYVRHIYTAMDRVGAPFCVYFWHQIKKTYSNFIFREEMKLL